MGPVREAIARLGRLRPHALCWPPLVVGPGPGRSPRNGGGRRTGEELGLHAYLERSTDAMLVLNAQHVIVDANAAAARLFGRPPESLRDSPALDVDLLARFLTAGSILQRSRTEAAPVVDEVAVSDAEGQPRQCRIQAMSLDDGRVLLGFQDTTAVLKLRAALRSAEQLRLAMLETLPAVSWTMALPEERLLEVSPSVEAMFGYQPSAFRTHPELWAELVHPADRERVRAELRRGIGGGRAFEIEFTGLHRDRRDLPYLVHRIVPLPDESGWVDRCQGFIEDRSDRRQLEAALHSTEAHLRHTLEAVSSGVLVLRLEEAGAAVVLCNRRFASLLQLDEPVRPGTPLSRTPAELRRFIGEARAPGETRPRLGAEETRDEIVELAEPHRVLRRYSAPIRDALGRVTGRIVSAEDVTSTWLMRRRLTHSQKMESMTRFAGGVAHDFNNLLGAIGGFASMLAEQTHPSDPRRESLVEIQRHVERAAHLTRALLDFSRSARFERMPVDLNRMIEESYRLLRAALEPGVAIEMDLSDALPAVMGDAVLLQQLLVQLVEEAGSPLASGDRLVIRTSVEDPGTADPASGSLRRVILEVGSTAASGSPPEPSPESAAGEAAGLSLAIAEDIARAHGGFFERLRSGERTRLRVGLPVSAAEEAPLLAPDEAAARGQETILVVDDESALRLVAKAGLQKRGFQVLTAENGEQALELLRSGPSSVDLVVLDLSMPGLSGERVLRTIRGFAPELPVVIASGYATVESQRAWTSAGAQGFVAKPYRIGDLAAKLREVLDRVHRRVP